MFCGHESHSRRSQKWWVNGAAARSFIGTTTTGSSLYACRVGSAESRNLQHHWRGEGITSGVRRAGRFFVFRRRTSQLSTKKQLRCWKNSICSRCEWRGAQNECISGSPQHHMSSAQRPQLLCIHFRCVFAPGGGVSCFIPCEFTARVMLQVPTLQLLQ